MTSKQCTTIAQALHLSDAEEAQLMLLALIARAPERLRPTLRQARLGLTLLAVDAVRTADPQDQLPAFIAAMDAVAEVWPTVKARWETPAAPRSRGHTPRAGQGPRPVVEVMTPPAPQTNARTVRQREKPRAE